MRCRRNDQARQIAQLEQKLNGLASLLDPSHRSVDDGKPNAITPESIGLTPNVSISKSTSSDPRYAVAQSLPTSEGYKTISSITHNSEPVIEGTSFATSKKKSQSDLLDLFRCDMAVQVPFISVSPQMPAEALSKERPFLYRSIITVASYHDSLCQLQMGQELVKSLTERLIVHGEKSMDLLQALLVYIYW